MIHAYGPVPSSGSDDGETRSSTAAAPPPSPGSPSSRSRLHDPESFAFSPSSPSSPSSIAYFFSEKVSAASSFGPEILRAYFLSSKKLLRRALAPLAPSFLGRNTSNGPERVGGLAALDGLRGIACVIVFNFHFLFAFSWRVMRGWGSREEEEWAHQLPVVRVLYAGRAMVSVFFALSGYVLARRALATMRAHAVDKALTGLASQTFRRPIRLYVPTLASAFMVLTMGWLGAFKLAAAVIDDGVTLAYHEQHPMPLPTVMAQLRDYVNFAAGYVDWAHWDERFNYYDPHLWTIPLEFRASMVLFISLLGLSRVRSGVRLLALTLMAAMWSRWGRFECVLFLGGAVIAELDLISDAWGDGGSGAGVQQWQRSGCCRWRRWWPCIELLVAVYLLSFPDDDGDMTPGFVQLTRTLVPGYLFGTARWYRIFHSSGALLALHAVCNSGTLRRPFETPVVQYFGRISYALYLMHGPVMHSIGFVLMRVLWGLAGRYEEIAGAVDGGNWATKLAERPDFSNGRYIGCLLVGWAICLGCSVCVADVFWRYVDTPSVRLARWAERRATAVGG